VLARSWLFAAVPVFLAAAVALAKVILSLVRATRAARVATVPLAAEARVRLEATGTLELALEGPHLTRDFAGVSFSLHRLDVGQEVPLRRLLFRTKVSGLDRVRLSLYQLDVAVPGEYFLRAEGLGATSGKSAVVFVRPLGLTLVTHVLGLIALGAALIGSLVVTGLVLAR